MGRWTTWLRGRANKPILHPFDISPDHNWNGTAGSGAAAPALDTSLQGAGFFCHPTANMLEVPGTWIGYDGLDNETVHPITIHADTSDAAGIKEVRVYMEGGTLIVNSVSWNELHCNFGYVFVPYCNALCAGEASVVIDVVPCNGYIRRLGPYTLTLNTNGRIVRPQVYVDYVNGTDDTASGRGQTTGAGAWKTVQYALRQCTDTSSAKGAIIRVAPGVQKESVNPTNATRNKNTRQITIAPYAGHDASDTTFTWADPTGAVDGRFYNDPAGNRGPGNIEVGAWLARFHNLTIDLAHINMWYPQGVGTHWDFHKCQMVDSNGPSGPVDTNPAWFAAWQTGGARGAVSPLRGSAYWAVAQTNFRNNEGGFCYLTECTSVNYVIAGARGLRNISHTGTFDASFITNTKLTTSTGAVYTSGDNTWFSNFSAYLISGYPQRICAYDHLTLACATYNGLNTIITVTEDATLIGPGSPGYSTATTNIYGRNVSQSFQAWKWLTGANIGRSSGGSLYESTSYDESGGYAGAHLKSQYMYASGTCLAVTSGAPGLLGCVTTAASTASAHYLEKGAPIVFYTTGTLPAGLAAGTTYYVSTAGYSSTGFCLAASQADALAGANTLAITTSGTGVLTYESRCLVVNGDFSTATGGSNVGDIIRGYLIAHADTVQFGMAGSLNQPNVQNLTIQNYQIYGSGIGNQFLLQTADFVASTRGSDGSFTYALAITAKAGTNAFSCPAGTTLWPNDFLRVADTAHPSYGEAARVLAYDTSTGTGTLALPFTHDLNGANCLQVKSCYGLSWQNVVIGNDQAWPACLGQWQNGVANFTVRQSTIVSQRQGLPTVATSEFVLRDKKGTNATLGLFGCEAFCIQDSIVEGISSEADWPAQAQIVNCRIRRLTSGNVQGPIDATSSVGDVIFDSTWSPSFVGTVQTIRGDSPFPWHYNPPMAQPVPRATNSNVGAIA